MSKIIKSLLKSTDYINFISELSLEDIENAIIYAKDKYFNTSEPVITDDIYDILIDFLKIKNSKSSVLKEIGFIVKNNNKVLLPYHMGSMTKIKPVSNQLELWTKNYNGPYNLSDKLDGISALLVYTFDEKINLYTRGTSKEGTDITFLIKYLNLPSYNEIFKVCKKNDIKGDTNLISFRGELVIKKEIFDKKWSHKFKTSRNTVGGVVNSKKINPELVSDIDLVLYEIIDPFYNIKTQFKFISKLDFNIVYNITLTEHELNYIYLSKMLVERRQKSIYDIDGIIVTDINNTIRNLDGDPEYAFAYKDILDDQKSTTTVLSVEWNISKHGHIIPTLNLEPIIIGNVKISRVTAHNAKFIVDNCIGKGAIIEIIRSGDVIPKITKILKKSNSETPDMPENKYHWNNTKVDIILDNIKNDENVLIKNIYFFFSSLETKGMGIKNVEKIINSGLNTIPKILNANKEDLLKVDGFKEKTVSNLIQSIEKSTTDVSFAKIMSASNKLGYGNGYEKMKNILIQYPTLLKDYKKWTVQEFINKIKSVSGWEEKTSSVFVNNFSDFIDFYNSIKKFITIALPKIIPITDQSESHIKIFENKIIVLTGFRDKILQNKIEELGGKISSSVSKNTFIIITKDKTISSDKITKGELLKIPILLIEEFKKKYKI